jgi:hypothetical protein
MNTTEEFEDIVNKSSFRTLPKQFTDRGNVLLAEKYTNWDEKYEKPHYQVLWAIERDGRMQVGRVLYIEPLDRRQGVYRHQTEEERINAAMTDAMQFMKDEGKRPMTVG